VPKRDLAETIPGPRIYAQERLPAGLPCRFGALFAGVDVNRSIRGRLSKLEAELIDHPWERVRPGFEVKLLEHEGKLYVKAQSQDRTNKERARRRRELRNLLESALRTPKNEIDCLRVACQDWRD
jgi:hypothetical protein